MCSQMLMGKGDANRTQILGWRASEYGRFEHHTGILTMALLL